MNDALETGLRHRLRRALRQTEEQHAVLRPLLAEVEDAGRAGRRDELTRKLALFRDALQAHFELEDQMLFPALHGLQAESQQALEALSRDHVRFLSELRDLLDAPERIDAAALSLLRARIGDHERSEEELVESIVGERPRG